jgi:hypothetical protein
VAEPENNQLRKVEALRVGTHRQRIVVICPPLQLGGLQPKLFPRELRVRSIMAGQFPPAAQVGSEKGDPQPKEEKKNRKDECKGKYFDRDFPSVICKG